MEVDLELREVLFKKFMKSPQTYMNSRNLNFLLHKREDTSVREVFLARYDAIFL